MPLELDVIEKQGWEAFHQTMSVVDVFDHVPVLTGEFTSAKWFTS
jgi:hypothetical protein